MLSNAVCNLMQAMLLTGDWDDIERVYQDATSEDTSKDDPVLAYSVALLRAFRHDSARLDAILPLMTRWPESEDAQDLAEAATALAAAAASTDNAAAALEYAQRAIANVDALGLRHDGIRWAWPIAADAALALDDRTEVRRLLAGLDDRPPGHIPLVLRGERFRIRARLHAAENGPEAGPAFESAVKAFRDFKSPYHLAIGLLDQAEHLVAIGAVDAAERSAAEAGTLATQLGARPLTERAAQVSGSRSPIDVPSAVMGGDP